MGSWQTLADLFHKQLGNDPFDVGTFPRSFVVITGGDKATLNPGNIQVVDVTRAIPKGCMVKARAFCFGVAFNSNFLADHAEPMMKVKLCGVEGSDQELAVIDLDQESNSKIPELDIVPGLLNSPAVKAMVSSVRGNNLAEFVDRVGEYVATKFGDEKKEEYVKMVKSKTSSGLGSLGSVQIWHMLTLQDRVMETVMNSFRHIPVVKMPITIDIPSASVTHPTPPVFGWKGGCSIWEESNRRPCIPDLNQVFMDFLEDEEAIVGNDGNFDAKKRKAEEATVGGDGTYNAKKKKAEEATVCAGGDGTYNAKKGKAVEAGD